MNIRIELEKIVDAALEKAVDDGLLGLDTAPKALLERPRDEANGDWATTVAMRCRKQAGKETQEIADIVIACMPENDLVESISFAHPGFINLRVKPAAYQGVLPEVRTQQADYGRGEVPDGPRNINIEYVSANPTGPMHVGHGRWAALGDATARVMRHAGYTVYEEFYVNDAGVQMDLFGQSVVCRYLQIAGFDVKMIENGYGGSYVRDIAQGIYDRDGGKWVDSDEEQRLEAFREMAYAEMLQLMKDTLSDFGNRFDCWFSERTLYAEAPDGTTAITRALDAMNESGYVYTDEGATWFKSTAFGDEKDRVLIKANGEKTYFMSDVAYHYDKLSRGFDHLINIWGADHHGYIKRCEAMMEAWNHPGQLEIILGQLVNLLRGGEAVRMSKRTGEMVTFRELLDEVGADSTRYLMLSRSNDQPIDFDIEVAKKKDNTNPVYYVQYAHARICSILRKAAGVSDDVPESWMDADAAAAACVAQDADLSLLSAEPEIALMRKMAEFEDLVADAARDRAPFRLTHYAQDLASLYHHFYTHCKVISDDAALQAARLYLIDAVRIVLAKTLDLLGVSAPEMM